MVVWFGFWVFVRLLDVGLGAELFYFGCLVVSLSVYLLFEISGCFGGYFLWGLALCGCCFAYVVAVIAVVVVVLVYVGGGLILAGGFVVFWFAWVFCA